MRSDKERFQVIYSEDADNFLHQLPIQVMEKIVYTITKSKYVIDPELFKKLEHTDIWEFRTLYNKAQYRLLAFWDKTESINTLVIVTHGFIKKTQKTPPKEITKAETIRKAYFKFRKIKR
ncbi:MAG: type II toxin-antitoxin system RelE/ParE family toxin [Mediterranea sp.]|jgi:phage-related protein|nr:type II toxin-antitoxin system RelE/ParE family toxin [Mediterranea sp.]